MAQRMLREMRAPVCAIIVLIMTFKTLSSEAASSLETNQSLANKTTEARSKVIEFNDSLAGEQSKEQRLALQIIITEPAVSAKKGHKSRRPPASILLARKRPYDLQDTLASNVIEQHSPWAKHFYVVEPSAVMATLGKTTSRPAPESSATATTSKPTPTVPTKAVSATPAADSLHKKAHLSFMQQLSASKDKLLTKRPLMNSRSELVRTQHRPPWLPRLAQMGSSSMLDLSAEMEVRKYLKKFKTTIAPMIVSTTTEFFKLISSAHSPLKFAPNKQSAPLSGSAAQTASRPISADRRNEPTSSVISRQTAASSSSIAYDDRHQQAGNTASAPAPAPAPGSAITDVQATTESVLDPRFALSSNETTLAPADPDLDPSSSPSPTSKAWPHPTAGSGSVTSPTIMFGTADDNKSTAAASNVYQSSLSSYTPTAHLTGVQDRDEQRRQSELGERRPPTVFNTTMGPDEAPLAYSDGKKIITLVRHKQRAGGGTSVAPVRKPSKIVVHEQAANSLEASRADPQLASTIRLISKQRHKYDDRVLSPTLTVVDNDAPRLPPNATSVHNNKLIVAFRPGRTRPRPVTTTQFPYYNLVAGITPPYTNNPSQIQYTRPPSIGGSVWGLLTTAKPMGADATIPSPSSFGAQNIRFPADPPANELLDPASAASASASATNENHLVESISKLNITVPASSADDLVPDKIQMQTEELHSRPPSDAIVVSNSTLVSRPHWANTTVNQDGIIRLSTTRRPQRTSTTKKISIVSANTTIVATNADQLHDVLSNFITGSHQSSQQTNQRPPERPGFFASLGNLLNASVTTSAVAMLTLIKTIFVAVLVMFLPPIALTAAIMQAINIG